MTLTDHNLHHLLSDEFLLRLFGIAGGLDLSAGSSGKANGKESEHVAVAGLALHKRLNDTVPFFHQSADLVTSHIHSVEVGVAIVIFHFFNLQLHFPPGFAVALVLQICQ